MYNINDKIVITMIIHHVELRVLRKDDYNFYLRIRCPLSYCSMFVNIEICLNDSVIGGRGLAGCGMIFLQRLIIDVKILIEIIVSGRPR